MPIINNPFNGKLNLDVAEYRIANGDYIDALNITKDSEGSGADKVVANILGNYILPYTLPSGTNKVIGFYGDKIRNRAYYFLWNSEGFNSIVYYDIDRDSVVKVFESKTDSDGIDILKFNPSYKVLSINIFYREIEGDLLYFNDSNEPPKYINVAGNYGTSWKYEYLLVIKAPPIMPPKVVYENDTTVTINNLRNSLFQFSYRYVYDNNEKSVWSSKSIVPLPQQPTANLTENTFTLNSRISISVSTGGADVKSIEISFRQTTNGVTSDWYLISLFHKEQLLIADNDIFTFKFYNDSIYVQLDIIETDLLQDWVPQKANASELANGNVLLYAGITEGYNRIPMDLSAFTNSNATNFFFDYCGLLFFAVSSGLDSGVSGTKMKIYLYGTGTNTSGIVTTLNNSAAIYIINAVDSIGSDIGVQVPITTVSSSVYTVLTIISFALIAKGFTQDSLVDNVLTMSNASVFILQSSGVKYTTAIGEPINTVYANSWDSGYQYAIQYFDGQGRTIGAQTATSAAYNTPTSNGNRFCQSFVQIKNIPPLEAIYFNLLRSNNITYNKRLYWVSESAYQGLAVTSQQNVRYAYIGIGNINEYNAEISSTTNVVSYTFSEGDRIKFLKRFDATTSEFSLSVVDYEVIGIETTIKYSIDNPLSPSNNTYTRVGRFLKIKYPLSDITSAINANGSFSFCGLEDFQHYEIFLYNYANNANVDKRTFFEFGKCFGIGNAGTSNAYHMGLEQTQSPTNPIGIPAIISSTNGDLFYRKRIVPFNFQYDFQSGNVDCYWVYQLLKITVPSPPPINNSAFQIQSQSQTNLTSLTDPSVYPTFANTDQFFFNKSLTRSQKIELKGEFSILSTATVDGTFSLYAIICTGTIPFSPKYIISILDNEFNIIIAGATLVITVDKVIELPLNSKMWIATSADIGFYINGFLLNTTIFNNAEIEIIEESFNDTYNLIKNNNGRPSVVDENAGKVYYPTLIRFGEAYQANTNLNNINRFYFENLDEYDRGFGDVMRLHIRDRYLKVYQKFKVGNVPVLTQIVKDVAGNPLQANSDQLINKIQYYAGNFGIGDASASLAWNNFSDYFTDDYRGVVCRLSQDGITPLSIIYNTNAFFTAKLPSFRQELNNGINNPAGNPCIYGAFDAYTNKYIISLEEINRYADCVFTGGVCHLIPVTPTTTTTTSTSTTTTTTIPPTTTTTTNGLLITNCISPLLNNETVGVQVFVRLTADYTLTSTITVNVSITTQYNTYIQNFICPNGTITSNHKCMYTSGNPDESAYLVVINTITPSSDSTYNYVNCI